MDRVHGILIAAAVLAAPAIATAGTADEVTPDVIFGSGVSNGSWTIDRANGVELGLRAKLRFNGSGFAENTFNWDGVDTYYFQPGVAPTKSFPTAVWSFEWSINSDYEGTLGRNLDDLTYLLSATSVASGTTFSFDPVNVTNADHGIGNNSTGNGAGDNDGPRSDADYAALIAGNNVAQNSWQAHWYLNPAFNPNAVGDYVFTLQAFDGTRMLAETQMTVTVVPLPPAALMGLGLLGGLGLMQRLRRRSS